MPKVKPPDQKNRERIAKKLNKSFFVEAGAGSGKTRSLIDRMAGLISEGEAKVDNIAAVTFTRKAAAELRERFQIRLENIFSGTDVSSMGKDRVNEALAHLDRAFIGTIHAFCAKLLRERSVEASIDPGFQEIQEQDNIVYALRVWNEYLENESIKGNKMISWMRENGVDTQELHSVFLKRSEYTDVIPVVDDVSKPDLKKDKETIKRFLTSLRKHMPTDEPAVGWDETQSVVVRSLRLIDIGYLKEDRKFIHLLRFLLKKHGFTQRKWKDYTTRDPKDIKADFIEFQETAVAGALRKWGEYLHKPLMEFVEGGVGEYKKWREERSLLNFQDLLTLTAGLLRKSREARKYFKANITHLLVDEFQDTDPIQAEIILLLTGKSDTEDDWRKVSPRPGSLFVVGDPKQSIYRFRRADIDIYNLVKNIFKKNGDGILELTANFRSLQQIGDITDSSFKSIFPEEDSKHQAKFAPLNTARDVDKKFDSGIYKNPIHKITRNKIDLIAVQDAHDIAQWINAALQGDIKLQRTEDELRAGLTPRPVPEDFMIITKTKKRLPCYAAALEKLGIPYEVTGGESFNVSEELKEIHKLLKCVSEPCDPVILIAVLRGPLFGVSDDELYKFMLSGGEFSYIKDLPDGCKAICNAYKLLREMRVISLSGSAFIAVEKIVELVGIVPLAASKEMGSTKAGNILKALELLREPQPGQAGSFADLADTLGTFLETKGKEEMSLFPGATNAVRIMNLHKAKGLEAPVVFLADPTGEPNEHDPVIHISRTGRDSKGYFAIACPKSPFSSVLRSFAIPLEWKKQVEEEKKYERAERKRLEYVAVTRARNILCISEYFPDKTRASQAWDCVNGFAESVTNITSDPVPSKKKNTFAIKKNDWEKENLKIKEMVDRINESSYVLTSVTRQAKGNATFEGGGGGSGRGWGNVVHKALEACGRGKRDKLELLAVNWMEEEDIREKDIFRLLRLVDSIMESDLWKRLLDSKEKYFEMPFSLAEGDTVLAGAIDLVFKEDGGWVIVDYKTDNYEKDPGRKKAYEKQLAIYAEHWENITGEPVKDKLLRHVT
ncbi:MAG: UvrD-helicase domain-containing protein [Candidatus Tantalella remota]|nr:UvrD-helicase domain-containing protein [Candidatus Tantalella remota]